MLALLAGILALQPRPEPAAAEVPVLTVARDLPSGHVLARTDLLPRSIPADLIPKGTLREATTVEGRVLSAAARSGEILTDTRLIGPELTRLTTGEGGHSAVAVRLAEPDVANLLHPGRRVDVVTTSSPASGTSVLAENVPVIAVRPAGDRREQNRLVLIGLPRAQATEVAAASVTHSLTVTLR